MGDDQGGDRNINGNAIRGLLEMEGKSGLVRRLLRLCAASGVGVIGRLSHVELV